MMATIINRELMKRQPPADGQLQPPEYNQLMIKDQNDFGERFERLRGKMSYQDLSNAIFLKTGVRITAQAMNKWVKQGGGITPDNARIISQFFNVKPGWLIFGEGAGPGEHIDDLIRDLPETDNYQTLDFIEYKVERATQFMTAEKLARYMNMIDKIRSDLDKRKKTGQ